MVSHWISDFNIWELRYLVLNGKANSLGFTINESNWKEIICVVHNYLDSMSCGLISLIKSYDLSALTIFSS